MPQLRWEPIREMVSLRDAVQSLLAESQIGPGSENESSIAPAVDIHESTQAFEIQCNLPGIKPSDVDITVHGNSVTISAESQAAENTENGHWVLRERMHVKYHRKVTLGCALDPDKVVARSENRVLKLYLPKAEKERPRRIEIS